MVVRAIKTLSLTKPEKTFFAWERKGKKKHENTTKHIGHTLQDATTPYRDRYM